MHMEELKNPLSNGLKFIYVYQILQINFVALNTNDKYQHFSFMKIYLWIQ